MKRSRSGASTSSLKSCEQSQDSQYVESQGSLTDVIGRMSMEAKNKIKIMMYSFTDKSGHRFVPQNCMFAYNPDDKEQVGAMEKKNKEMLNSFFKNHIKPEPIFIESRMPYNDLTHIGGCSYGFTSRKFLEKGNSWHVKKERKPRSSKKTK